MNPVIGLDISKGESQIQAFLDKAEPYRKGFSIRIRQFQFTRIPS